MDLRATIEEAINLVSRENESNTPDWVLAQYLMDCLKAFEIATKARDKWYGISLSPPILTGGSNDRSPLPVAF